MGGGVRVKLKNVSGSRTICEPSLINIALFSAKIENDFSVRMIT